ncbi:hypothetical protein [Nonomuraea angiospora]
MPAVRQSIFQTSSPTTTVTPPGGTQTGDLLVAFLSYESQSWASTLTGGTPEWQLLTSKVTTSIATSALGAIASGIWWKPATGGETSWVLGGSGGIEGSYMAMAVIAITDAPLQAPLYTESADQTSSVSGNLLTSVSSPAGPIPAVGDVELRWVGADNFPTAATRLWSEPASMIEVVDLSAQYVTAQLTQQTLTSASSPARAHTVSPGIYAAHGFTLRIRGPVASTRSVVSPASATHRAASW